MERKIGVYVCECGPNIAEKVDIDKVINAVSSLEGVAVVEKYKLLNNSLNLSKLPFSFSSFFNK